MAPGTVVAVQAPAPPAGLVLTNAWGPDTATHRVGLAHETPLRVLAPGSWVWLQAPRPSLGDVVVKTDPPLSTATHMLAFGHETSVKAVEVVAGAVTWCQAVNPIELTTTWSSWLVPAS